MQRLLLTLIFINWALFLQAQEKYYFTSFWRLTNHENACFYRVGVVRSETQKFAGDFVDYRIDHSKIQEGSYSVEGTKTGLFKYYHPNGQVHSEGQYFSNEPVGIWKFYFEDGTLDKIVDMEKIPFVILQKQDSAGHEEIKDGTGFWSEEFPFGRVSAELFESKRIGIWRVVLANGEILVEEKYEDGKLVGAEQSDINKLFFTEYVPNYLIEELKSHDATKTDYPSIRSLPESFMDMAGDSTLVFTQVEQMPTPRFNDYEYLNFLYSNLEFQDQSVLTKRREVILQIWVDPLGSVYKVETIKGLGLKYDQEAERVMKMTKWIPGYQKGVPVNVTMVRRVSFPFN